MNKVTFEELMADPVATLGRYSEAPDERFAEIIAAGKTIEDPSERLIFFAADRGAGSGASAAADPLKAVDPAVRPKKGPWRRSERPFPSPSFLSWRPILRFYRFSSDSPLLNI